MTRHYSAVTTIEARARLIPHGPALLDSDNTRPRATARYSVRYPAVHPSAEFGILPEIALLGLGFETLLSDMSGYWMVYRTLSIALGVTLGIVTFYAQSKLYGEYKRSGLYKALIVAALTAIPSPLVLLLIPAGLIGIREAGI